MSCGLIAILSRIKLAWFVFKHPEWKCKPWCLKCEFYDNCLLEYEAETGETIEGIPIEDPVFEYGLWEYDIRD